MYHVEFIVPYPELAVVVEQAFQEFSEREQLKLNVRIEDLREVQRKQSFNGDVIIARGLTASFIRELGLDIPLIEIPMVGYDIIKAVSIGIKRFKPRHIAFIGTANAIYGVEALQMFFGVELTSYSIEHQDDIRSLVEHVKKQGADLIIGGHLIHHEAEKQGLNTVVIESGKEGVRQALGEALRTVIIRHQEMAKAQRFRSLVENVHEGIISVDKSGNISVINQDACSMLSSSVEQAIGKPIEDMLPNVRFSRLSRLREATFGRLISLGSLSLSINEIPIQVEGHTEGFLITLQDVTRIQEIESRIRREAHKKGLVARYRFSDIIGKDLSITNALRLAYDYSRVDSNVLIVGETGTGKELFAQGVHNASDRRGGPFVAINCAALPESLLESELFGYAEGAFTGAAKGGKSGLFELAHRGTIFLDEISEISLFIQGRLLRVLEEREIMRLGHDTVVPVDIRIIAATNKDLRQLVSSGAFREDLLYRLDVLRLSIPPVRHRGDDLQLLVRHFLASFFGQRGEAVKEIGTDGWNFLLRQQWEGNVRQIRNFCERLAVISKKQHINSSEVRDAYGSEFGLGEQTAVSGRLKEETDERTHILNILSQTGFAKGEAARILGVDRSTLWRKMKRLGID